MFKGYIKITEPTVPVRMEIGELTATVTARPPELPKNVSPNNQSNYIYHGYVALVERMKTNESAKTDLACLCYL